MKLKDRKGRPIYVSIAGHDWTIVWMPDEQWQEEEDREDGNSGETTVSTNTIWIRTSPHVSEANTREILFHELMHACLGTTGHTYLWRYVKKEDQEEMFVSGLSPALLAVLRNNPHVLEYLLS